MVPRDETYGPREYKAVCVIKLSFGTSWTIHPSYNSLPPPIQSIHPPPQWLTWSVTISVSKCPPSHPFPYNFRVTTVHQLSLNHNQTDETNRDGRVGKGYRLGLLNVQRNGGDDGRKRGNWSLKRSRRRDSRGHLNSTGQGSSLSSVYHLGDLLVVDV